MSDLIACTHCRLPVPTGLVREGATEQFCCHGCETAYRLIHECGLDAYYKIQQASDSADGLTPRFGQADYSELEQYQEYDSDKFQ